MYDVFDGYLNRDTWHTGHANEDEAFHRALARVVDHPDFHPDTMGDHMRKAKGAIANGQGAFDVAIDKRVQDAWAVKDFRTFNPGA